MIKRKLTREVQIGDLTIGGDNPIRVQSMTTTKTVDIEGTVKQIIELENAGCEIIRVTASTMEDTKVLGEIKRQIHIPLVVDIHFQYQFALEAIKQGVDKVRINPGNIGGKDHIKEVVLACKEKNIPIRIGINSGSLEKDLFSEFGNKGIPFVMLKSAERNIKLLESLDFKNIVVSLKGSDVQTTIEAYELFSEYFDYPTHVGITEAGTLWNGALKSAVGIGSILSRGIGDTIRVSLSANPVEEVKAGWQILKSLGLRQKGVNFIACPTCGRTEIDLIGLANKVEQAVQDIEAPITIAVMGCVVNGPGEASFADIGLCGGKKQAAIFRGNTVIATIPEKEALQRFMEEIKKLLIEKGYHRDAEKIEN
jgi:(E)-4-hydroxy-3-methylbut-2-enyl-diphosphate synthase